MLHLQIILEQGIYRWMIFPGLHAPHGLCALLRIEARNFAEGTLTVPVNNAPATIWALARADRQGFRRAE